MAGEAVGWALAVALPAGVADGGAGVSEGGVEGACAQAAEAKRKEAKTARAAGRREKKDCDFKGREIAHYLADAPGNARVRPASGAR